MASPSNQDHVNPNVPQSDGPLRLDHASDKEVNSKARGAEEVMASAIKEKAAQTSKGETKTSQEDSGKGQPETKRYQATPDIKGSRVGKPLPDLKPSPASVLRRADSSHRGRGNKPNALSTHDTGSRESLKPPAEKSSRDTMDIKPSLALPPSAFKSLPPSVVRAPSSNSMKAPDAATGRLAPDGVRAQQKGEDRVGVPSERRADAEGIYPMKATVSVFC